MRVIAVAVEHPFDVPVQRPQHADPRSLGSQVEPVTSGSARALARFVTHAGICKVKWWAFEMP
jgi:hypothetical protein